MTKYLFGMFVAACWIPSVNAETHAQCFGGTCAPAPSFQYYAVPQPPVIYRQPVAPVVRYYHTPIRTALFGRYRYIPTGPAVPMGNCPNGQCQPQATEPRVDVHAPGVDVEIR